MRKDQVTPRVTLLGLLLFPVHFVGTNSSFHDLLCIQTSIFIKDNISRVSYPRPPFRPLKLYSYLAICIYSYHPSLTGMCILLILVFVYCAVENDKHIFYTCDRIIFCYTTLLILWSYKLCIFVGSTVKACAGC